MKLTKINYVLIGLLVSLLFAGCVTNKGVYPADSEIPAEELSGLTVKSGIVVVTFDDNAVNWNNSVGSLFGGSTKVSVTPGKHVLVIDSHDSSSAMGSSTIGMGSTRSAVELNFIPGHNYYIARAGYNILIIKNYKGFKIRDVTAKKWLLNTRTGLDAREEQE